MKRVVLIAIALAACDGGGGKKAESKPRQGQTPETKQGQKAESKPGQVQAVGRGNSGKAFPANTPPAQACQVDADCTVAVDAAVGPDPCCNVTTTAMPIAVRYVQFMDQWQKANCAGVSCPPMNLPGAQTAPCGMRGHCDKGSCTNSCGLAPDGGPAPPPP